MARLGPARIVDRPKRFPTGQLELVTGKNGMGTMLKRLPYSTEAHKEQVRSELRTLAVELKVQVIEP